MQKEEYKRRTEGQISTLAHQEQEHSAPTGCHAGSRLLFTLPEMYLSEETYRTLLYEHLRCSINFEMLMFS